MHDPLSESIDHVVDLYSRLRLDHSVRERGAVVVEGPGDETALSRAFAIDKREIFPLNGRNNVLRFAEELVAAPLTGVTCVADQDFDEAAASVDDVDILVFYDGADLEAMIFETPVLERFLDEWASGTKMEEFGAVDAFRLAAVSSLQPLSRLRSKNAAMDWRLPFDSVDLRGVIDTSTLDVPTAKLVDRLARSSARSRTELLEATASAGTTCQFSGRPLTRGKDLLMFLEVALRKVIGSLSKQQVQRDFVARSLRTMIGAGDLGATEFASRFGAARIAAS